MPIMPTPGELRTRFAELHRDGTFVMPNPWDVGSAKLLENAGFPALATTSAGFAWTLGVEDQEVTREQLLEHVNGLVPATGLPLSVDAERCYADDPAGVAETVDLLRAAGAAGCSIEDYNPATGAIDPVDEAVERVAAAADAAHGAGAPMVLTARCENLLYDLADLDDTIERLRAYRAAGADCVYAPGLATIGQITTVVAAVAAPLNVLAWPGGPSVPELAAAGVRRISVGSALASAAYGALVRAGEELLGPGTTTFRDGGLRSTDRTAFQRRSG